ncbi:bifunctional phosphopantothenoylcysteine decarboxylase/phosphopantothenate--cysteine ligase CoaBC [Gulosibacter bifidus]|uniref:Coenzyme A biosynthesis bifunctional protein CoaBC n=1 Tax=Gulosibacter bifidus TaxID=272239 RepID=A0ABW5RFM9_9MICO|nr:bifunctional phosphopantothenoylcysteine decarboxylase/phosphopantothenate--cysteine ligase CoaBC [Gulosibacter bifidus]
MPRANPTPLRIVIGITGGIAAYKAVSVIRALVLAGHHVDVIATEAALRFVGAPTLEAISRNPLHTSLYDGVAEVRHVSLGQRADVIGIVPATADTLARMTAGIANDLLTNTVLATTSPVVVAPAMHTEMWQHAATQHNVATLRERGVAFVGPDSGQLTGDDSGPGRLADPDVIAAEIIAAGMRARSEDDETATAGQRVAQDLAGVRILVTAGGTREPLDPVRFLGNRSSGKQGVAVASRAVSRGAEVTLIAANLEVDVPEGINCVRVERATEMADACHARAAGTDVIVMAAAVADYRPAQQVPGKIKKSDAGESLTLELVQNPDILRELVTERNERGAQGEQCIVGFAAETEPDDAARLAIARAKIARKGCDFLVCNRVDEALGFGQDQNTVDVLDLRGEVRASASADKMSVADTILDVVVAQRANAR